MSDPRELDVMQLADVLREHAEDVWLPYVNELERRYFQLWARSILERADVAHRLAVLNETVRGAA